MMKVYRWLPIVICLTGCSVLPKPPRTPVTLTFDVAPPTAPAPSRRDAVLVLEPVTAAASLRDSAVFYRRKGEAVMRRYAYHRWLAPPAELIDQAVWESLAPRLPYRAVVRPGSVVAAHELTITLLRLEQVFTAADRSELHLVLQAVWQDADTGKILATRLFRYRQPAAPSAEGAALAAGKALARFFEDLSRWLGAHSVSHEGASPVSGTAYQ